MQPLEPPMHADRWSSFAHAAASAAGELRSRPPAAPVDAARDAVAILDREGLLSGAYVCGDDGPRYRVPHDAVLGALVALGGADLCTARIYEGHLNAMQLVSLYGTRAQRERVAAAVSDSTLMGVWGADGTPPFRLSQCKDALRCSGTKRYVSGLGTVGLALVPFDQEGGMGLLLADVTAPERANAGAWNMRGMQATLSGTFDFEGMVATAGDLVGAPGNYKREPYFVGGIWRCAAAHLGAIERIVALTVRELDPAGRLEHPLQSARVGEAMMAARTARLWIEDAAACVEAGGGPDIARTVAHAAFARLRTEAAGVAVCEITERAIGLKTFDRDHPVGALIADLRVYLRQANPDALLLEHTRAIAKRIVGAP